MFLEAFGNFVDQTKPCCPARGLNIWAAQWSEMTWETCVHGRCAVINVTLPLIVCLSTGNDCHTSETSFDNPCSGMHLELGGPRVSPSQGRMKPSPASESCVISILSPPALILHFCKHSVLLVLSSAILRSYKALWCNHPFFWGEELWEGYRWKGYTYSCILILNDFKTLVEVGTNFRYLFPLLLMEL